MSQSPRAPLSPEEERIIKHQGTEPPGSGRYWRHAEAGVYLCRQCGAPLFLSEQKFPSACGWPSFDQARPGAVQERPDPDRRRTEIVCAQCGGHLGHVFRGERLTPRNTRFCVNSLSLDFKPQAELETALFAGGCFWGLEAAFSQEPGVVGVTSGYSGGHLENPDYEAVGSGRSGHAETVQVLFDPQETSYEHLARLFFELHDPGQKDRQGPDIGPQYRSAIFYRSDAQREIAEKLTAELRANGWPVLTVLEPAGVFYPAEEYHQQYWRKHGRPAGHFRVPRFGIENKKR